MKHEHCRHCGHSITWFYSPVCSFGVKHEPDHWIHYFGSHKKCNYCSEGGMCRCENPEPKIEGEKK
jgi:hypothetical protein